MFLLKTGVNTEDIKACQKVQLFSSLKVCLFFLMFQMCCCNLFQRVKASQQKHDRRRLEMESAKSWHIYLVKAELEI